MALLRFARRLIRYRRLERRARMTRAWDELRRRTQSFCDATSLPARSQRFARLFAFIWSEREDSAFLAQLLRWIQLMDSNPALKAEFQRSWAEMLVELNAVPLFAEAGLPANFGLFAEVRRRLISRILPSARESSDAGLLFTNIFSSEKAVDRFIGLDPALYERLAELLRPEGNGDVALRLRQALRQALRLLATRVGGRGVTAAVRARGSSPDVHDSPFYRLIFATEVFVDGAKPVLGQDSPLLQAMLWRAAVRSCREELDRVHLHMEDAGVSSALVFDLQSMESSIERMELLAAAFSASSPVDQESLRPARARNAARALLGALVRGRLDDTRLRLLFRQNLTLLARKTVERTGFSGEHYVAQTRGDYWQMWRAAAGGGLLTVFTAAIKLRIAGGHLPLFVEGFLIGTDYAVSFVLLQIFHLALATKQPSMTAAALAGIIRENRGVSRWTKISSYAAQIGRTQLAAAFGNVLAVCIGGVVFAFLWHKVSGRPYLSESSAEHAYHGMNPFESGTILFAAFTGVVLWVGGLAGGWAENFVVFHRIPDAVRQHPLGYRIGSRSLQRAADWLERNVAAWSNSIVLGYLLGLSPVIARFFGIPLDVRHVTLNTGMVALAAAQFGVGVFRQSWLYYAIAGVGFTFVLNLSVSFSIASVVALRAYNVPRREQFEIFGFIFRQFLRSPMDFIFPRRTDSLESAIEPTPVGSQIEEYADKR
jgi:site-specific recombinase